MGENSKLQILRDASLLPNRKPLRTQSHRRNIKRIYTRLQHLGVMLYDAPIIFGTVLIVIFLLTSRCVLLYNELSRLPMGMSDVDKSFVNMYS